MAAVIGLFVCSVTPALASLKQGLCVLVHEHPDHQTSKDARSVFGNEALRRGWQPDQIRIHIPAQPHDLLSCYTDPNITEIVFVAHSQVRPENPQYADFLALIQADQTYLKSLISEMAYGLQKLATELQDQSYSRFPRYQANDFEADSTLNFKQVKRTLRRKSLYCRTTTRGPRYKFSPNAQLRQFCDLVRMRDHAVEGLQTGAARYRFVPYLDRVFKILGSKPTRVRRIRFAGCEMEKVFERYPSLKATLESANIEVDQAPISRWAQFWTGEDLVSISNKSWLRKSLFID